MRIRVELEKLSPHGGYMERGFYEIWGVSSEEVAKAVALGRTATDSYVNRLLAAKLPHHLKTAHILDWQFTDGGATHYA